MKRYILINQVIGPLFIDIANAFAEKEGTIELFGGQVEKTSTDLNKSIKTKLLRRYDKTTLSRRILSWGIFTIQMFFKMLFKRGKNTKVLYVTNPPLTPFIGLLFYKLFKRNYSVLVFDIYPDALVNFNFLNSESLIIKLWKRANYHLLSNAEHVFTISEFMASTIKGYYDKHDNLVVVPNWVDSTFIKPIPKEENWFAKEHNQLDKLTILYSGNLGITHDLESLVEAANILKDREDINFVIIGEGGKKVLIEEMVQKYQLNNVTVLPFQDSEVIPFSMAMGDVGVVTLAKGAEHLSVPSKTYYMMAAGTIILAIAEEDSELGQLVNQYDVGYVIPPEQPEKVVEFLRDLKENEHLMKEKRENSLKTSALFTPENAKVYVDKMHF